MLVKKKPILRQVCALHTFTVKVSFIWSAAYLCKHGRSKLHPRGSNEICCQQDVPASAQNEHQ